MMEERLRLEFNDWARAGRGDRMERVHRPTGEQAIERMNVPTDARVLDVGCGSGWATRLLAEQASRGRAVGIDISDDMIALARAASAGIENIEFQVASAERLPFDDQSFTHAFSMESLYYYSDMAAALSEIRRVLQPAGLFVAVLDLYWENEPSHQWIEQLKVPVQLLSIAEYHAQFEVAGFLDVRDERMYNPKLGTEDDSSGSFKTREDYMNYLATGSLMMSGRVKA
jgi:ubiquinone/menaquinone biosynthesis C-methylase UbiE